MAGHNKDGALRPMEEGPQCYHARQVITQPPFLVDSDIHEQSSSSEHIISPTEITHKYLHIHAPQCGVDNGIFQSVLQLESLHILFLCCWSKPFHKNNFLVYADGSLNRKRKIDHTMLFGLKDLPLHT